MELKLDGYLTKEQYLLGNKLYLHTIATDKTRFVIQIGQFEMVAGGGLAVIGIGLLANDSLGLGILLFAVGLFLGYLGYLQRQVPHKLWENIKDLHLSGSVSDDGIVLRSPNGQNSYRWSDFSGYGAEGDIVLLIPRNSNMGHIIPQQMFQDHQSWLVSKSLLAVKLPLTRSFQRQNVSFEKSEAMLWILIAVAALAILIQFVR
jgi:hypothetical protein